MALFDTIKEDWEKLKGKPFKDKVGYFADYYKWHVIVVVFLIGMIGGTIYQKATTPEAVLSGALFNASELTAEEPLQRMVEEFSALQGLEKGKETILLHTDLTYVEDGDLVTANYESLEILTVRILTGELDFIIADRALLQKLAEGGYLLEIPDSNGEYLRDVSGSERLQSVYGTLSKGLTLGMAVSTEKTQMVLDFLDYLEG